jgi:regulator of replication initiation timing
VRGVKMEINRVNLVEKDDKFGVLSKQIKTDDASNETIQSLLKTVGRLTMENSKLKAELNELHNGANNNGIESEEITESFLTGNCDGYDIDELAKAYYFNLR